MKKVKWGRWVLLYFLAAACTQEQASTKKFFDFDGLIDDQISELGQNGRVLEKTSSMAHEHLDSTFLPSAKGWESELEIFRDLEMSNKPAYRNAYRMDDLLKDPKSNLKIRQYTSTEAPLHMLRFYYQNEFSRLRKIEASITEKNYLYTTSRILVMEFEEDEGKSQLIRYSMNGFQKMAFSDTVRFSVEGQLDW